MCPSIAVMGGGGGGGGSGGKNGSAGDGAAGGDGGGSGDEAGADGAGAGNCGQGGQGGCTNCHDGTSAGDPVDVISGEVFTVPHLDLVLPGPIALHWERSYSSRARTRDVGMGFGWAFSFGWRLVVRRDRLLVWTGRGDEIGFPLPEAVGVDSERVSGFVARKNADGSYRVIAPDAFAHTFEADPSEAGAFRLRSATHELGGGFELVHGKYGLQQVTDSAGRRIDVRTDTARRIVAIEVTDPYDGRTIRFASFTYDDAGNLVEHVDADGSCTSYAYDDRHRLESLTYPNGLRFHYVYDEQDRCVETWGEHPDLDAVLATSTPSVLADGSTKAKGVFHNLFTYGPDGYVEVLDSVRLMRFFANEQGKIIKGVSPVGGVTTRDIDEHGRMRSHTDPLEARTRFEWDREGRLTARIDPLGRREEYIRDELGRVIQNVLPDGGIVESFRDPWGRVATVVDQLGGTTSYLFDARGLLSSTTAQNGSTTHYQTDLHGNLVVMTMHDGSTWRWSWDHFGRPTQRTDPRGLVTRYEYSDAGKLLRVIEPDGRTIGYAYDTMGSCIAMTAAGRTVQHRYGALRWRFAEVYPDGTSTQFRFNREGWCTEIINEVGERSTIQYDRRGLAKSVRLFDGSERRNRWDAVGRLSAYDAGDGWVELERDPVGRVLKIAYPDGTEASIEYDDADRIRRVVGEGGSVSFERDLLGRIVGETQTAAGFSAFVATRYDAVGNVTSSASSLGHESAAGYDALGRRKQLHLDHRTTSFEHDTLGFPSRTELPSGGVIDTAWDTRPRVASRAVRSPGTGSAPAPVWAARYSYDEVDNLIAVDASGKEERLRYDLRGRLLHRGKDDGTVEEFEVSSSGRYHPVGLSQTTAPGGRIVERDGTRYSWNDAGRLVEKQTPDGRTTRFGWDARGQLASVELPDGRLVVHSYDPFGRRTTKRVLSKRADGSRRQDSVVLYVWNQTTLLHEYVDIQTEPRAKVRITYVHDGGFRVFAERRDELVDGAPSLGEWRFHVHDQAGGLAALVDARGQLVTELERTAFGRYSPTDSRESKVRMLGQLEDEETRLHYNHHRYFDPELGTYISGDPIGFRGGLELYGYGVNPIGYVDPLGLQHECTCRLVTPNGPPGNHGPSGPGTGIARSGNPVPGFCSGFGSVAAPRHIPAMDDGAPTGTPTRNASMATSHTEMHATEWAEHHFRNDTGALEGSEMFLGGQHPPCAMCNNRMRSFAEKHKATVEYNWPVNNRLRYDGRPGADGTRDGRPRAVAHGDNAPTADARELEAANQTTAASRRRARAQGAAPGDETVDAHRAVYQRQMAAREAPDHASNSPERGGHVDDTWP